MAGSVYNIVISIHAPLTGGDIVCRHSFVGRYDFNPRPPHGRRQRLWMSRTGDYEFQSTPPSREATKDYNPTESGTVISIHAPLTGGDQS